MWRYQSIEGDPDSKNQYKIMFSLAKKYHHQKKLQCNFHSFNLPVYTARYLKCMGFNCFKFLQINENPGGNKNRLSQVFKMKLNLKVTIKNFFFTLICIYYFGDKHSQLKKVSWTLSQK